MRNLALILTVMLFLFCPSCSIWEDREHCPGILALDCSLLEGKALYADIWIFSTAGILLAKNRISEHDFHELQEYEVPKDDYMCYVWANVGDGTLYTDINSFSASFHKVSGRDADPLFSYCSQTSCRKDYSLVRVVPKKMFIDVTVMINGLSASDNANFSLVSPWDGFNLSEEFLKQDSYVYAQGRDFVKMRILRPKNLDGIHLDVTYNFANGETLFSVLDLGGYLESVGYDLSLQELKDVVITVDINKMRTGIGIEPFISTPPVTIKF